MAPAYFLDQSTGDLATRFFQNLLQAERTRHNLLEEERTRLMYRRFGNELEATRDAIGELLKDYAVQLEAARQQAREEATIAREEATIAREEATIAREEATIARLESAAFMKRHARAVRRIALPAKVIRLLKHVSARRSGTAIRLLFHGDVATIRERGRYLAEVHEFDDGSAGLQPRTPVVVQAEPWPSDLPLVSVVVVCFNYGAYVREAIDSVLGQTAALHCEVIVVDGGSTDPKTVETMRQLAANPPLRTRVLLREGRHLVGDNRNFGIEHARGRYVACLDADDLLDPRYIEVALYLLERRGYDLVSTATQCFEQSDEYFGLPLSPDLGDMSAMNCVTTVAVYRRELWKRAGGYHDTGLGADYVFEDWKLWHRIAALGARMTNIQAPLFRYRVHSSDSLSRQDGGIPALGEHRAAVLAFNDDIHTPRAVAESARRRGLEVTVEGGFDNLEIVEEPHRPTVLFVLPFLIIGGAERLLSAVAAHLSSAGFRVVVTSTLDVAPEFGDSTSWFEEATSEVYHLPRLLRPEYAEDFLDYIVESKRVDVLFVAGSEFAYHQLPGLRRDTRSSAS